MRILQCTPRLPHPPSDGGRVVMRQIAMAMQRQGATVRILSLNPRKQHADLQTARRALAPIAVEAVDIDTSAHLAAVFRSFRIGAPHLVARFYSPRFAAALRAQLRAQDTDVVQIESPFLLPYVPAIREVSGATVVLRSLNVEFRIWEQLAAREERLSRRTMLRAVAHTLRQYEIRHLNTCDAVVPITAEDASDLRALGCTRPIYVLPAGVDMEEEIAGTGESAAVAETTDAAAFRHSERAVRRVGEESPTDAAAKVGFLASLDYRPNQEAAIWIAEELCPRLKAQIHIAGSNAPEWLRERLVSSGVSFDGEVPDAAAFIRSMDVMISPIFSGGGMRIKILEAMAGLRPVVATTLGAAGIEVRQGENILLADDPEDFAQAVSDLLNDPARAQSIAEAGRRLVETHYSTDALARGLLLFYQELAQRSNVHGSARS